MAGQLAAHAANEKPLPNLAITGLLQDERRHIVCAAPALSESVRQ
jgi:hypothetical protein